MAASYTDEEMKRLRQVELNQINYARIGAAINGGYVTPDEEAMAKLRKEREEKEKVRRDTVHSMTVRTKT